MDKSLRARWTGYFLIATLVTGLACMVGGELAGRFARAYRLQTGLREIGGLLLLASAVGTLLSGRRGPLEGPQPPVSSLDLRDHQSPTATVEQYVVAANRHRELHVDLRGCSVDGPLVDALAKLPLIATLDLRGCSFAPEALDRLDQLRQASVIRFSGDYVDPWDLRQLQVALPACEIFDEQGARADDLPVPHRRPGLARSTANSPETGSFFAS